MNLQQAVELAKKGKEEGYNYLYQQTYQKSYYVAFKYIKQEDSALDILQDAYIKAFQNLEQLQDAEKFPAWFSKIVATTALNELKKRKVVLFSQMEKENDSTSIDELFQDERIEAQPELSLDKKETSRLVQEMINVLSDEQRLCIMMYYVEEMEVKDIAETLGVSENTVKSRLNYGRKNIKDKVLELEKKGTKLYSLAPIPFFLYLLLSDTMNAQAAELPVNHILETATKEVLKGAQGAGAGTIAQAGGKAMGLMTKKLIIGIVTTIVIGGGTIGGVLAYQNYQNQQAEEAMAVQQEEARKEAEEAERLEEEKRLEEESRKEASKEATQQPAEEPTVEPTEQPAEEPTVEPTEQPTEEPTEVPSEPTEEPTQPVEAEPQFTFTDLSATMYAQKNVNIRDLPSTDGNKLGGISTNQEIAVNGQCNETGWYRFDYNGTTAYVSDKYLGDSQVEIATSTAGSSNSSSSAMSRNAADYRSISSLSELSAGAGWDTDWEGFKTNYKSIEKVAYTHNGITVLLYDYQWDNTVIYYDFTYPNAPWRRTNASYVDAEIEAGGSKYYKYPNGVETEYMDPISNFQVY